MPIDDLKRWKEMAAAVPAPQEHSVAGISGGRTSALMAHLLPPETRLVFCNTGREHPKTLDFLLQLEDDLQRPIIRVEYRAPPRGDEPKYSTFEVVSHSALSRRGEPFADMLLCLKAYRAKHKNKGPTGPWANSRICTAHLKLKTKARLCASWGWSAGDFTDYVGLRADEPKRLQKMQWRNYDRNGDERALLAEIDIEKPDVLRFWDAKPYNLQIPEYLGNCTGCFLKDEGDLALALSEPETDAAWWFVVDEKFAPLRRGRSSYRQVHMEAPFRRRIRTALECGIAEPECEPGFSPQRHRLLVRQERKRMLEGSEGFSCSCEAAERMDDNADE